ncbi:MAG: hypothetical protein J7J92_02760 [Candidatus Aenigmarchaeota archaeon]|nr:hypothetical protein [Candidatus Aenigmarchaeota archaeon]
MKFSKINKLDLGILAADGMMITSLVFIYSKPIEEISYLEEAVACLDWIGLAASAMVISGKIRPYLSKLKKRIEYF